MFVGNAWDPQPGRETPWIDLARQIAGDPGVEALGASAATTPPGTEAIGRVFAAADAPVLVLLDEVLNFVNRHRGMADSLFAFIQNLTVAMTGTTRAAAVISLPRSQVEMTELDQQWHDRITKVVRRVARDLIANDESEIGEVVRRRLFEDIGDERIRKRVAQRIRRLVLRTQRTAAAGVERGHGGDGPRRRFSARAVRGLLSVSPGDAFGISAKMAGASRSFNRRAAPSPCSRSGYRLPRASISRKHGASR